MRLYLNLVDGWHFVSRGLYLFEMFDTAANIDSMRVDASSVTLGGHTNWKHRLSGFSQLSDSPGVPCRSRDGAQFQT
jgi:hypothetical protein